MHAHLRGAIVTCVTAVVAGAATFSGGAVAAPDTATTSSTSTAGVARTAYQDFNDDGYQDLAIGAPGAHGSSASAGYVVITYGSATGLDPATRTVISQDSLGVPGRAEPGDHFGSRLVGRDLDSDGITDLAVHSPGETSSASPEPGSVTVLWGGQDSRSGFRSTILSLLPTGGVLAGGAQLTGGDFQGDGFSDLLMWHSGNRQYTVLEGPFTRDGAPASARTVALTSGDSEIFTVAAGDMTGDGVDDLAVFRSFEEMAHAGQFFRGGPTGLTPGRDLPPGASATVGDFDQDGYGDLAYRVVPGGVVENLPYDHGTVKVIYGSATGPGERGATFTQDTAGVPGVNEAGDQFGAVLAAGDLNGDRYTDLVAGVPFEALGERAEAGSVVQLLGGPGGLTGSGSRAFHQDTAGVGGVAEAGDHYGGSVRLLDLDDDTTADLAVGVPDENQRTGAVNWLPGTGSGLTSTGSVSFGPSDLDAPTGPGRLGLTFAQAAYGPLWGRD